MSLNKLATFGVLGTVLVLGSCHKTEVIDDTGAVAEVAAPEPVSPRDWLLGTPAEIKALTSKQLSLALQDTYSDFVHNSIDQEEGKCDQIFQLGEDETGPNIRTISVAVMKDEAGQNAGLVIGDYQENISQRRRRGFSDTASPYFGTLDDFTYAHKIWTVIKVPLKSGNGATMVRTNDFTSGVPNFNTAPDDFQELMLDIAINGNPFRCE